MRHLKPSLASLPTSHGPSVRATARPQLGARATLLAAAATALLLAILAAAATGSLAGVGATSATRSASPSADRLPAGLQQAVDHTLAGQPLTSPSGLRVAWGTGGRVDFSVGASGTARHATRSSLALQPTSVERVDAGTVSFAPGGFVFGARGTSEQLGAGVSARYRITRAGAEQLFTLRRRPAGSGRELVLSERILGGLRATQLSRGQISFSDANGSALRYGGLKVTDARGHVLPAHLVLVGRSVRIEIDDAHAAYPLRIDPYVAPSLVATFTGAAEQDQLGSSVGVSADGQTAVVGEVGTGELLVYTQSGGSWSSSPAATLTASGASDLGYSVAISADGRTIVAGAPTVSSSAGEVVVYTESGSGTWSRATEFTGSGSGDELGHAVAVSADGATVVAGEPGVSASAGAAAVYVESDDSWSNTPTTASLTDSGTSGLGTAVAVSDDGGTVVAGAPETNTNAGQALIFTAATSGWASTSSPTKVYSGSGSQRLGSAVAVSADGQEVAAGVPTDGDVDIYDETGGSWPVSGSSISGETSFGSTVALSADGQTLVAGAPGALGGGGSVSVYSHSSGSWPVEATATYDGPGAWELGASVAISADGQTIATGAPAAESTGAVNVYGTAFTGYQSAPAASYTEVSSSAVASLGDAAAVSADGQTVAVSAVLADSRNGEVFVYHEADGSWPTNPTQTITGSSDEEIGSSLALSADGETLVIGAQLGDSGDGSVYVYNASSVTWSSSPTLSQTLDGTSLNDGFGTAVAVSGDAQTLAVSAPVAGSDEDGQVYIYRNGSSTAATTFTGAQVNGVGQQLGSSLALSGDGKTLVIGAPYTQDLSSGPPGGDAYVCSDESGSWLCQSGSNSSWESFNATDPTYPGYDEELGYSVAISADGRTIAIGSPGEQGSDDESEDGLLDIFAIGSNGVWPSLESVNASYEGSGGEGLGWAVAVSDDGQTVTAGAPFADSSNGAVEIYSEADGSWPGGASTSYTNASDYDLGAAVAVAGDGQTVVAGAPSDTAGSGNGYLALYSALVPTTTSAGSVGISYSPTARNVNLSASVASASNISVGSVTFRVMSGSTLIGSATSGSVSDGSASVNYGIPAGTAAGTYTIDASYSDSGTTYGDSSDDSQSLTISQAAQSVSFSSSSPSDPAFGSTYAVQASATSGLTVAYSIDPSTSPADTCTSDADIVTFAHAGSCVIDAAQSGNGNYTPATTRSQTVVVPQESTDTTVGSTNSTLTATVTAANGTPTGTVDFTVGGTAVGSAALQNGVATLAYVLSPAQSSTVAASYAGSSDYLGSSGSSSASGTEPTITATLSSSGKESASGWWDAPVTVTFACTANGGTLTAACPGATTLSQNAADQAVTETIHTTQGGVATVTGGPVNIDAAAPVVKLGGVSTGATYVGTAPTATCAATAVSGIVSCTVKSESSGTSVSYTAMATSGSGLTGQATATVTELKEQSVALSPAGISVSESGSKIHIYAVYPTRPRYVKAVAAPKKPSQLGAYLKRDGSIARVKRWELTLSLKPSKGASEKFDVGLLEGRIVKVVRVTAKR